MVCHATWDLAVVTDSLGMFGWSRVAATLASLLGAIAELQTLAVSDESLQDRIDSVRLMFKKLCANLKRYQPFSAAELTAF